MMKNVLRFELSSLPLRQATQTALMLLVVFAAMISAQAQVTTGTLRGLVKDPNGAVVPGAKVTITDKTNGSSQSTQTANGGEYEFTNLLPSDYTMTIEANNFKTLTVNEVKVSANKVNDVPVELAVGARTESVTVSAGGTELVQTSTTTLSKDFGARQVVELAQTSTGAATGINNLALIAPGVTSSGGVGVGAGGSVGGQRPRNNDFIVDGVDNNDKAVTGPQIYVSPETVQEFSLLTNQYSAEYGHSTGGQFITVTKSGTNGFHGTAYDFLQNRLLNALDTQQKNGGVVRTLGTDNSNPRFDFNRWGGNVGGPILKNKLFFFTSYERYALGRAASPAGISAPTSAGLAAIAALPGISAANFGIFKQYVPVAAAHDLPAGSMTMCAGIRPTSGANAGVCPGPLGGTFVDIPVGSVTFAAPNFQNQKNFMVNIDFTQSSKTQHRGRFIWNNQSIIDNSATFPIFYNLIPVQGRLFSYTLTHSFTPTVTNETRLAYRRFFQSFQVPDIQYPGLDVFPNIGLGDLGINIGPDGNAPQFNIENNYQVVDTLTWTKGAHSIKFGGDFRKLISPQSFVQRQRGDYEYNTADLYLRDIAPDFLGERSVGASAYYGDQKMLFSFVQDDWRIRPNVTLNLGLSHVYEELPFSARNQTINSISSVPGLLVFGEPKSQKKNFAPRIGVAWSPNYSSGYLGKVFGGAGQSSIRASFQMAYDVIFDNLYILSLPPQANQTVDVGSNGPGNPGVSTNFIGGGAIGPGVIPVAGNAANARAATSAWIPDQKLPHSQSWSLGYQRQFRKDWSLELRYVGSRGINLLTQNRINVQNRVTDTPGGFLPTFLSAPSQATLDALTTTLTAIQARPRIVPEFSAAGFNANVVAFLSNGSSNYHGGSATLTRRFARGFQMSAAYTWSHLIDDTTAEVFSTVLSPRRVQDFRNLSAERSTSALNHTHRFVTSGIYDLPYFNKSKNRWARTFLGGINFSGTFTIESGEYVTVLSGNDANQNGDSAGDRTIINPAGAFNTASNVTALKRTDGQTVGYLATNPSARYIRAGNGALANAGRNTFLSPAIKNLDFSIFKNFAITETKKIQLGADLFNAFNHPQYVPGSVNTVDPIATTGVNQYNTIANGLTDLFVADHIFSSHPRVIQLRLRFTF
jgi:Carboxypeptidase regulatory-like domain